MREHHTAGTSHNPVSSGGMAESREAKRHADWTKAGTGVNSPTSPGSTSLREQAPRDSVGSNPTAAAHPIALLPLPPETFAPLRRMVAGNHYAEGDYVTRGDDGVHQCTNLNEAGDLADFVCVVAPSTGWTLVGEVETNLTRRYSRVDWTPPATGDAHA